MRTGRIMEDHGRLKCRCMGVIPISGLLHYVVVGLGGWIPYDSYCSFIIVNLIHALLMVMYTNSSSTEIIICHWFINSP